MVKNYSRLFLMAFLAVIFSIHPVLPVRAADPQPIVVDTLADEMTVDGKCSLREAIQAMNSASTVDTCLPSSIATIQLSEESYTLSIPGTNEDDNATGDLDIHSSLTLIGSGSGSTIIDANQIDRVMQVFAGAEVSLKGMTVQNGHAPDGPFSEASCTGGEGQPGGGILNDGSLAMDDVALLNNSAGSGGQPNQDICYDAIMGNGASGGGVYNRGTLTLDHSRLEGNSSGAGPSTTGRLFDGAGAGGDGGGIANIGGALTITDTVLKNNSAAQGGSFPNPPGGSGYARDGIGGGLLTTGQTDISNSQFLSNAAGEGGGIYAASSSLTVKISSSVISQNRTYDGAENKAAGHGGGIYNVGTMQIMDSAIIGNITGHGENAGSHNTGESAGGSGGGIYNAGNLQLINSTISGNQTGWGGYKPGFSYEFAGNGNGAGIANLGALRASYITVARNTINKQIDEDTTGYGAGIYNEVGTVWLHGSILAENTSPANVPDCFGTLVGANYNLIESIIGCSLSGVAHGNVIGRKAWLNSINDNGGPTPTHSLQALSQAIGRSNCMDLYGNPVKFDQRGMDRPTASGSCDIGAFESGLTKPWQLNLVLVFR